VKGKLPPQGLLVAAVALLAAIASLNTLRNGFVWDDQELIVGNDAVKSAGSLGKSLTRDFFAHRSDDLAYGYYRPLTTLSYAADYAAWRLRPAGFHATNVLLHAACAWLGTLLLLRLGLAAGAALTAGVLFAVHPIHVESVAWISGRTDLLSLFLALLSFLLFLRASDGGERPSKSRAALLVAASAALYAGALLAKEMSLVLLLWLFLADRRAPKRRLACTLRALAPYVAVTAGYLVWRFLALGVPVPSNQELQSPAAVALSAPITVARYLAWLAWPVAPSAYVQNPYVTSAGAARFLLPLGALSLLGLGAFRLARRSPHAALLGAMLAASFLPLLNIVRIAGPVDMGAVMAERFCYWPSLPFAALLGLAVSVAWADGIVWRRAGAALLVVAAATAGAAATWKRNGEWIDEVTFLRSSLERSPRATLLWNRLACQLTRENRLDEAREAVAAAKRIDAYDYHTVASQVFWLATSGRPEEAIPLQEGLARQLTRGRTEVLNNLAWLYRRAGRYDMAEEVLLGLVRDGRSSFDVEVNLGELYRARGDLSGAGLHLNEALRLNPDSIPVVEALAAVALSAGDYDRAEALQRKSLASDPANASLRNDLALTRFRRGDVRGAADLFARLVADEPAYVRARINYSECLHALGRTGEGISELNEALRLAQDPLLRDLAARRLRVLAIASGRLLGGPLRAGMPPLPGRP
jgi:tetratricopeptide (TPR) repeat protein